MQKLNLFFKKIHFPKEIILLCIVIIILLYPLILYPYYNVFPQTDIPIYFAWKSFLIDSFKTFGYIPLWNPYVFGGSPFIGNIQVGFFYPINIIYFIIPLERAFAYSFLIDYLLIGLFTYLYARLLHLSKFSSLISAISVTFNGAIMKQLFLGHTIIMDSIAWLPLQLYLYEKLLQKNNIKYVVFSGIVFGITLLTGTVQLPLYAFMGLSLYYFIRIFLEYKINKNIKKWLILAPILTLIIGLSMAAIQLLPTLELSSLSIRGQGISYEFASGFSFHPKEFLLIIFPSIFGLDSNNSFWGIGSFWGTSIYTGIVPFFLAFIGLIYKRNKYIYALLLLSIFSVLYSFGNYGIIFKLFYDYIPFFNNFRVPTRILFIYAFSFAIFSGFGAEYILEKLKKKQYSFFNKFSKILLLILFISSIMYAFLYLNKNNIELFEKIVLKNSLAQNINHNVVYLLILDNILYFCIFIFLLFLIFLLFKFKKISGRIFRYLVIILIALDFFIFYSQFYNQNNFKKTYQFFKEFSFIKQDKSKFRIFLLPSGNENLTSNNKLENITGIDALYLFLYRNFIWEIGPHLNLPYEDWIYINEIKNVNNLRLLNVKYILSKDILRVNGASLVYKSNYYIYKINNYLPRAYVTYKNSSNFDINKTKIEPVKISIYQPNKILLNLIMKTHGYLVLSENYYPGWEAYDNNKKINIVISNKIFRSVYLQKGYHEIKFIYNPFSFVIGQMLTSITLSILIIYFLFTYRTYLLQPLKKYLKRS